MTSQTSRGGIQRAKEPAMLLDLAGSCPAMAEKQRLRKCRYRRTLVDRYLHNSAWEEDLTASRTGIPRHEGAGLHLLRHRQLHRVRIEPEQEKKVLCPPTSSPRQSNLLVKFSVFVSIPSAHDGEIMRHNISKNKQKNGADTRGCCERGREPLFMLQLKFYPPCCFTRSIHIQRIGNGQNISRHSTHYHMPDHYGTVLVWTCAMSVCQWAPNRASFERGWELVRVIWTSRRSIKT